MKGIVLAAGTGSRLRPITLRKPKCTVTVAGRSILEHQIRAYEASPATECVVVTGYKHEDVCDHCVELESRYDIDISITRNEIYANTDNLYSLYRAFEDHEFEEFILSNGDVVFPKDTLAHFSAAGEENAILCDTDTYSGEGMKIETNDRGTIDRISKEIGSETAHATSTDVYRFSPETASSFVENVTSRIQRNTAHDLWVEEELTRLLGSEAHTFDPVSIGDRPWAEIDNQEDLLDADRQFASIGDITEKEAVFFDLDGTIYTDDELTSGADEVVRTLRASGTEVFFLSNNSSTDKRTYVEKLASMGIDVDPENIVLSTDGTVRFLNQNNVDSTYVVGTEKLREEFRRHDIDPVADDPTHVVVGFDTELTYEKVRRASKEIQQGARFFATHPDLACPSKGGFIPDAGAITALVEATVGTEPDRVFGKPRPEMLDHILDDRGIEPDDVLVVGDRLRTEIELGNRLGCDSVCVLTGDSDREDVEQSSSRPSAVLPDVAALQPFLGS